MSEKVTHIFFMILCGIALASLTACYGGFMSKSVPIRDYLDQNKSVVTEDEKALAQSIVEIKKMTIVNENNVFTERRGYPEYVVGPGDILTIDFWEGPLPKPSDVAVKPNGKISYSFVDNLTVNGLTPSEIAQSLIASLKDYIRSPRLDVTVKEYKSKTTLLAGQINNLQQGISGPGRYNLKGKTSVLDLIVIAGGPIVGRTGPTRGVTGGGGAGAISTGDSDMRHVELVRKGQKFTLNLYDAMFKGDMSQNVILDDGDIVTVPELPIFGERIYIFGEVMSEGIYRLKDAADVLSAISMATGFTTTAVKENIRIVRAYKERNRKPIVLSVNYWDIVRRADFSQNIILQDGDLVYVPRTFIGDVNQFITNTTPLLDYIFYPSRYRDSYMNTNWMRMNSF